MLPTPDTSHLSFTHIYEPAEDSYLLLDTLSSPNETAFLNTHFPRTTSTPPLVVEVGIGSGIVLSFLTANASHIFGRSDILTLGTDASVYACQATPQTVKKEITRVQSSNSSSGNCTGTFLGSITMDLYAALKPGSVDVLVFNPPYVPTPEVPPLPQPQPGPAQMPISSFEEESHYLALTYAGGKLGLEITDRLLNSLGEVLSERGVAYVLLCAQNKPEEVAEKLRRGDYSEGGGGSGVKWNVEKVGSSGKKAGWEVLSIWRIWR